MMTDPIADMLTRIRNASLVRKHEVNIPYSKIKLAIAEILKREGYLESALEVKGADQHPCLTIKLKYSDGQPAIQHLKRISRPGCRRYVKKDEIKQILNGFGLAILTTPRGILTGAEAKAANVGGELICEVY